MYFIVCKFLYIYNINFVVVENIENIVKVKFERNLYTKKIIII